MKRFDAAPNATNAINDRRQALEEQRQALEERRQAIKQASLEEGWLGDAGSQIDKLEDRMNGLTPEQKLKFIGEQGELIDQQGKTVSSFEEFIKQRPTEEDYVEPSPQEWLEDKPEKRAEHEEFLENASLEELALAARAATESQYESGVTTEIMATLEKRVREQEKYDILDDSYGIKDDLNHPLYGEYYNALRELNEEMGRYYDLANPDSSTDVQATTAEAAKPASGEVVTEFWTNEARARYDALDNPDSIAGGEAERVDAEQEEVESGNVAADIIDALDSYDAESVIFSEEQETVKKDSVETIIDAAGHVTEVELNPDSDEESAPEDTPEPSEELDEESTEEDEGEESKLNWREKRKIKKEAREELKKKRRELKGRMRVARKMDNASQRYEERKKYLNELNELKNSDLYEKAGNRAKVYSFYDDQMTAVGEVRNRRYTRSEELQASNRLYDEKVVELNKEKEEGKLDRKEFGDKLDKLRVEREDRNKAIKKKYSTVDYLKKRYLSSSEATEVGSEAEKEDAK